MSFPNSHQVEFRCDGRLHGIRREYPDGRVFLEIRCKEQICGAIRKANQVVLHYFDIETGKLNHTRRFKDPGIKRNRIRT